MKLWLTNLGGKKVLRAIIRKDIKDPRRIFCEFPPYASLTHEEAIMIANRLIDVMESEVNGRA